MKMVIILALAVLAASSGAVYADESARHCLNKEQRHGAIANRQAVPLATAIRAVRIHGQVVRARLCEGQKGLVYVLTVLARDGKVTRATVDASSGMLLAGG